MGTGIVILRRISKDRYTILGWVYWDKYPGMGIQVVLTSLVNLCFDTDCCAIIVAGKALVHAIVFLDCTWNYQTSPARSLLDLCPIYRQVLIIEHPSETGGKQELRFSIRLFVYFFYVLSVRKNTSGTFNNVILLYNKAGPEYSKTRKSQSYQCD